MELKTILNLRNFRILNIKLVVRIERENTQVFQEQLCSNTRNERDARVTFTYEFTKEKCLKKYMV